MKIVVVGDIVVPTELLEEAASKLQTEEEKQIVSCTWETTDRLDFRRRAQNLELNGPEAEEAPKELLDEIEDAEILMVHFCPVSKKLIERAKKLRLIATCRGGMEHVDVKAATERNIPVVHVIRNAEATSDFAIGLMFAETRNIARAHAAMRNGVWLKDYVNAGYTTTMREMTLGVVGLGNIGKLVAEKAIGLGMKVIGHDPYISQEQMDEKGLDIQMLSKEEVFRQADIISLHLRVTLETENSINKDYIDLMKPTAYLINTSRAKVLVKEDLLDALENKKIGGAALDVFWDEPLEPDDPLLKLENITLTPHNAGSVVDALPKSPKLLVNTINDYWEKGKSDMVVNRISWKG